jgi:hypothetical protein
MPDVYLRSIELLIVIVLSCMCRKGAQVDEVRRREKDDRRTATIIPKGDLQCPTAPKVLDPAEPRDAQFVMASLVSSGTTRGDPPLFQEVRRSPQSSPGERPQLAGLAPNRLRPGDREPREGTMTFQISQRGKEYLETARTLLRDCPNHDRPSDCGSA